MSEKNRQRRKVYQIALPYRSFQFADIFFDALGISLSLLILYIAWRTARGIDGAMSKK